MREPLDVEAWLTSRQLEEMCTRPDMLVDFAHHVADRLQGGLRGAARHHGQGRRVAATEVPATSSIRRSTSRRSRAASSTTRWVLDCTLTVGTGVDQASFGHARGTKPALHPTIGHQRERSRHIIRLRPRARDRFGRYGDACRSSQRPSTKIHQTCSFVRHCCPSRHCHGSSTAGSHASRRTGAGRAGRRRRRSVAIQEDGVRDRVGRHRVPVRDRRRRREEPGERLDLREREARDPGQLELAERHRQRDRREEVLVAQAHRRPPRPSRPTAAPAARAARRRPRSPTAPNDARAPGPGGRSRRPRRDPRRTSSPSDPQVEGTVSPSTRATSPNVAPPRSRG